jgi:DNA ligase-associated metallophosphoesterase
MNSFSPHLILNNHFLLTANRTIFWEEEKALILSDLHIGKSGHFRKHGIGIPQNMFSEDMQRLFADIQLYKPAKLIIVGDLFHSHSNKEHDLFLKWRNDLPHVEMHLVMGNHDILKKEWYAEAGIIVHECSLTISSFIFTHDISCLETIEDKYYFSGHIHPGITMRGIGKQSLSLPCFYFNKKFAVLPAFGRFTGTYPVLPQQGDAVFVLAKNSIIQLQ